MQYALNTAPDIKLTLDNKGVITDVDLANEIASENINNWLGIRWLETVSNAESKKLDNLLYKASESTTSSYLQINQTLPSGLTIPIEYMAVRLGDNTGFLAIGRDVRIVANLQSRLSTIQKTIERDHWKLKKVESHYLKLFESSNEAMMIVNCNDYHISEANPAAIIALELPSNIANWNIIDHAVSADHKLLNTSLKRACSTGKSPAVLIHFGKQQIPWLVKASLIDFENSENILVQLQSCQENYKETTYLEKLSFTNFINRLPEAFVIISLNGKILEGNSVFYELTNITNDAQLINKNLSEFIQHEEESIIKILASNANIRNLTCNLITLDNSMVKASISTIHVNDPQQAKIGVCIHTRNQKELSEESAGINGLLDSKVDQIGKVSFRNLISSSIELVEKHYIETALSMTKGNRTAAAKLLRLSRQSLYIKLARINAKK